MDMDIDNILWYRYISFYLKYQDHSDLGNPFYTTFKKHNFGCKIIETKG